MKFHQLRDALAIAENRSIRAAARKLGLAQPTLTRSVRELEGELGVVLFSREPRGMIPTEAGKSFLQRARLVVNELRRAQEDAAQHRDGAEGSIVVCLSSVVHLTLLPRALPLFMARYPQVSIEIIEALYPSIEMRLKEGTVDFFFGSVSGQRVGRDFLAETCFENRRAVFCRRGHPLAGAKRLRELVDAQWLSPVNAEREFSELFTRHKLPVPRPCVYQHSALTTLISLMHANLLAFMPPEWADSPVTSNLVQRIRVKEVLAGTPTVLVRRAAVPLTPAADFFGKVLIEAAKQSRAPSGLE